MTDYTDPNNQNNVPSQNPQNTTTDWRSMRRAERAERREERKMVRQSSAYGWIAGVVLILIGLGFLAQNFGGFRMDNWWALFILIPAVGSLAAAYENYRTNQSLTTAGRSSLVLGVFLTALTVMFLFDLSMSIFWPALLILAGVALLAGGLFK